MKDVHKTLKLPVQVIKEGWVVIVDRDSQRRKFD